MNTTALTADNSYYWKSDEVFDKPEVLIAQQREEIIEKFQWLSRNFETAISKAS
jgi:hypothetical protein